MGLKAIQPTAVGPGTHATTDRLVVVPGALRSGAADRQVVHAAVTGRRYAQRDGLSQRAEDHIDHTRAGLDVAGRHRRRLACVQQAALRHIQHDRPESTRTGRGLGRHQAAKHVIDSCGRHRERTVDVSRDLRGRAAEIRDNALVGDGQGDLDRDIPVSLAVVVEAIGKGVAARRDVGQRRPRQALGVVVQRHDALAEFRNAVTGDKPAQARRAGPVGRQLSGEITLGFGAVAGRLRQPLHYLRQQMVAAHQVHRLNHHTFVIEPGRDRHRPRRSRADIRMVRAVDHERTKRLVMKYRCDHRDIGQVGAAEKRVIEDHLVSRTPGDARDDVSHRKRHAAQVHRDVSGLRAQGTIDIEHRAGEVQAIADIGRKCGVAQDQPHFAAHGIEATGKDIQAGWSHGQGNGIRRMAALIQLRLKPGSTATLSARLPAGFSTFFTSPAETRLKASSRSP